ncbi:MAG: peptidase S41 [Marinilabiliales bacterium]|nr:MAG: peptidase S41 [Marinilabiliales bacterium]
MHKLIFISLFIATIVLSCEKLLIESDCEDTPVNNFELMWEIIDRNYSFFEYKNINWDSIYDSYRPRISNELSDSELFQVLSGMLFELRDGHVNLYSGFGNSRNVEWYSLFSPNFNSELLEQYYLIDDYETWGPFYTKVFDSIGYVYIGSFSERINNADIDAVIERLYDTRGIIFDVRNNSGGFGSSGEIITGRFADKRRLVSYTLYKSGPGHNDFTAPQPNFVGPLGDKQYTGKVVVLTNRRVYSATNDFVLYMSSLPHVTIMGDTTGGGGGTPYDYELYNGWRFRIPRTMTLAYNGFNVENGIPPDINVRLSANDLRDGIDTIIEAALEHISGTNTSKN